MATAFTTRRGGLSRPPYHERNVGHQVGDDPGAVAANRAELAREVGLPVDRVVWLNQVHGTRIALMDQAAAGAVPDTDAVITAVPELALAVLVADCVPVLFADPVAGVVGASHVGRVGAAAGIVPLVLAAMVRLGAEPARLRVVLGPAICGGCYEVPPELRDEVDSQLPGSACRTGQGTAGLDLRAGLARQLVDHGVTEVHRDSRCTAEDGELFSYRRDGVTGRQAGLVWLRS
ncbi:MAG: peptidoglycan editing factor PgeF [Actinobacteria bacterium]|nr:peptidoglycan editing factor PgeF [Actinomycetota bacterium]